MKNKIIDLRIHTYGTLNDSIVRMVTNHNAGKANVDEGLIRQRCHCYYAEWSSTSPTFQMKGNEHNLEIWEKDKLTITLQWKEVTELNETESAHALQITDKELS